MTTPGTSLLAGHPAIAAEWHPSRNGNLLPTQVLAGSNRSVWWRCALGHEWRGKVIDRARRHSRCPYCAGRYLVPERSLGALRSELAAEWHPGRNGDLGPLMVAVGSHRRVWWACPAGHEWEAVVFSRTRSKGTGCPFCSGLKVTLVGSLAALGPELARQWHPRRNGELTAADIAPSSDRRVWWACPAGHEWQARVKDRSGRQCGCPHCSRKKVAPELSLLAHNPELAAEWHPGHNGERGPGDVAPRSGLRVWWRCAEGHEWQAKVVNRERHGTGCPQCAPRGKKGIPLEVAAPWLLEEWATDLNGYC